MLALAASRGWARVRQVVVVKAKSNQLIRHLCDRRNGNETSNDEGDEDEFEFGMDDFGVGEDDEIDIDQTLKSLQDSGEEITPEIASDLVDRLVKGAMPKIGERPAPEHIIPFITPHTIATLRACRITTNHIHESQGSNYPHPLEKKVNAEIAIDQLELSRPARRALEILAGSRLKENYVKMSCNQFPSLEENRMFIVSRIDRLVKAAKEAVGENVDMRALETWENIREEVRAQAKEEIDEAGSLSLVLGEAKGEMKHNTAVTA